MQRGRNIAFKCPFKIFAVEAIALYKLTLGSTSRALTTVTCSCVRPSAVNDIISSTKTSPVKTVLGAIFMMGYQRSVPKNKIFSTSGVLQFLHQR